jgi:hypothetical protein
MTFVHFITELFFVAVGIFAVASIIQTLRGKW